MKPEPRGSSPAVSSPAASQPSLADAVLIRTYEPADAAQVQQLFADGMRDAHSVEGGAAPPCSDAHAVFIVAYVNHGVEDLKANMQTVWFDTIPPGSFWCAVDRRAGSPTLGAIVGIVGGQALSAGELELRRMAVHSGARGMGLATKMVGVLEAHAREHGFKRVVLSTGYVMQPAQRLYAKLGYVKIGDPQGFPDEYMLMMTGKTAGGDPGLQYVSYTKSMGDGLGVAAAAAAGASNRYTVAANARHAAAAPPTTVPAADAEHRHRRRRRNRYRMYLMIAGQGLTNWVPKTSLPSLIPLMATSFGWSDAQKATLLSAFFPGYLITQLPGSYLIQRIGPKAVLTINMLSTAVILLLVPLTSSVAGLSVLLGLMGVVQGPFIPAQNCLKREWMPQGAERAFAVRVVGLGNNVSNVLASSLTPLLAVNLGWRSVPIVYGAACGVFGLWWHATVSDKPESEPEPEPEPEPELAAAAPEPEPTKAAVVTSTSSVPAEEQEEEKKTVEWRIFSHPAVISCIAARVGFGAVGFGLQIWAPTIIVDLGASPVQAGVLLAWTTPFSILGDFMSAAVESALLKKQWSLLTIRRSATVIASIFQSAGILGFALAKTPPIAAAMYVWCFASYGIHRSGFSANLLEVGGQDTAILNAVTNVLGNIPAAFSPAVGIALHRITHSWLPFFGGIAAFNLVAGLLFGRWASLKDGRELLKIKDQGKDYRKLQTQKQN